MASSQSKLSWAARRDRRKEIAKAVLGGNPLHHVARQFDVSTVTVRKACVENGITPPAVRGRPSRSDQFVVLKMLMDGMPQADVARQLGVSRQRISEVAGHAARVGIQLNCGQYGNLTSDGSLLCRHVPGVWPRNRGRLHPRLARR